MERLMRRDSSTPPPRVAGCLAFGISVLLTLCNVARAQMGVEVVHAFPMPGPFGPKASLIEATDGNFYGVTKRGGLDDCGTIFRMTPSAQVTVIHTFNCTEGKGPFLSLVQAQDGFLYGTAPLQGSAGAAIAFRTTLEGAFEVIHVFSESPSTALVQGVDGNLYGGTYFRGSASGGIFRMTLAGDVVELLDIPRGGLNVLVAGPGAAMFGAMIAPEPPIGSRHRTTIFAMTVDGSTTSLYSVLSPPCDPFNCLPTPPPPGYGTHVLVATPTALYGADPMGHWYGNVFRLDAGGFAVLHSFESFGSVGAVPMGLTRGPDGHFYGVTSRLGDFGQGSLFRMTPDGDVTLLHAFDPATDGGPAAGSLAQAADGTLVGLTEEPGELDVLGWGAAFAFSMSGDFSVRHRFASLDGAAPNYLIRASDGMLYGTTARGGALNFGVLFQLSSAGTTDVLHDFSFRELAALSPYLPGGADTAPTLMEAVDGTFYGTTFGSGTHHGGTLFRATPSGEYVDLLSFSGSAAQPVAPVVQATDGALYGTTLFGPSVGDGAAYRFTSGEGLNIVHSFDASTEGQLPAAALLEASDGALYGTTAGGGSGDLGTVFRMTRDGSVTTLHSFGGAEDGAGPVAPLIQASDGNFYGTTFKGGPADLGSIFRLTPTGTYVVLHTFNGADGANPSAALLEAADGNLYGVTQAGGAHDRGAAFRLTMGGLFTVMHSFDGTDGERPSRPLVQGTDGFLYGTAQRGGPSGGGVVFRLFDVSCENTLTLGYGDGTLQIGFQLRSAMPTVWSGWLVALGQVYPMWSVSIPAIMPAASWTQPISPFPQVGLVGVLSVMADPAFQSRCFDWKVVDTGR